MKLGRSLYLLVTALVAGSFVVEGIAVWFYSGLEEGGRLSGWNPLLLVCCVIGTVGVIWLDWYWLRLAKGVASIIAQLVETEQPTDLPGTIKRVWGPARVKQKKSFAWFKTTIINKLNEAIDKQTAKYSNDITAVETQRKDLQIQIRLTQRQKRDTEAIIYSIRDAVIVVDEFDKLRMANESAGQLFNFDFKSSEHKPISELIEPEKSEFVELLRQSRRSKARATRREMEFSQNGKLKTFNCIVSCVYDQSEQVCGVVAVLHDITREKEISQMKNDFVSAVSHELKTPLASICAYSEMLLDDEAPDDQTRKEFYSVIQSQAERLNRLIEDLLNTSRIESGLMKVNKEPVSLTILIEEQLQMIKSYAEEKNIRIIGQKPIVFDQVYADRDMISQVIVNLLSNAVKYTPGGGSVKVETAVDQIAGMVRVSVTDTGVGIGENEIGHIFDKFYRIAGSQRQAEGTGLGLNLVKQIVEKVHNGRVFVSSVPGQGSTFGFELPLATAEVIEV